MKENQSIQEEPARFSPAAKVLILRQMLWGASFYGVYVLLTRFFLEELNYSEADTLMMLGAFGAVGIKGERGIAGIKGEQGAMGIKGERGIVGMKGVRRAVGMKGDRGIMGMKGRKGDKGDKGESVKAIQASVVPQTNCKQCVWQSGSDTDNGKIKVHKIRIITHS